MFDRRDVTHPRPGRPPLPIRRQVDPAHELAALALVLRTSRNDFLKGVANAPRLLEHELPAVRDALDLALRSMVGATTLDNSPVVQSMAAALFGQLEGHSAYAAIAPRAVPAALRTRLAAVAQSIVASPTGETHHKPLSGLALDPADLVPGKCSALVVITDELAQLGLADASAQLHALLLASLATAVDELFLGMIAPTPVGASTLWPLADVAALLAAIGRHAAEDLVLVASATTCGELACAMDSTTGAPLFPAMRPSGGELAGLEVLASSAVPISSSGGELWLIDASQIAHAADAPRFDVSQEAALNMTDASGETGAKNLVSLWQTDSFAALIERRIAAARLRADAVARLSAVDYSALNEAPA